MHVFTSHLPVQLHQLGRVVVDAVQLLEPEALGGYPLLQEGEPAASILERGGDIDEG